MRYREVTGYIIHHQNLGEADRIITIFSIQEGKQKAIAKGVRKAKAKLAGHLEPFTLCNLRLTKGRNLDIIIGAEAIELSDFSKLSSQALQTAYLIIEVLGKLSAEGEPNTIAINLVTESLRALHAGVDALLVRQYFGLNFLSSIGNQPDLTDTKLGNNHYLVYGSGKLSRSRPQGHYGIISIPTIKLWRLILSHQLTSLAKLQNINQAIEEGEKLLMRYYEYHFDIKFKSTKVFQGNDL